METFSFKNSSKTHHMLPLWTSPQGPLKLVVMVFASLSLSTTEFPPSKPFVLCSRHFAFYVLWFCICVLLHFHFIQTHFCSLHFLGFGFLRVKLWGLVGLIEVGVGWVFMVLWVGVGEVLLFGEIGLLHRIRTQKVVLHRC